MSSGIPFGNYRLIRRLAAGGMAEVFLATQRGPEGFERTVAVKRILPHLADVPQFVEMFMDEARLAARLSHPNVCHIYEFGQADGSYFIAMEFVDGMDLSAVILDGERKPLPIEHGARVIADTCAALNHAHQLRGPDGSSLGIVHRDISPQNILVSFDGTVKVVDFGIAKAAYHINRTRPGVVRGKYTYMSPEQVDGKKLDGRADIFCAGIVLYELATGGMLFSRNDAVKAMLQIRDGDVPVPRRQGKALPSELERIIRKALAFSPDDRFASGAEMQLALEEFLRGCTPTSNSILLGEYFRKHYRKYHPEPVIAPVSDDEPRGTRAVDHEPRGTVAVSGRASTKTAGVSDEVSSETTVAPARSGNIGQRAAQPTPGRHLGPLPIEDPMGLLRGSAPGPAAQQPPWTGLVVRPKETTAGEFSTGEETSGPSIFEQSVIPSISGETFQTIDESGQTAVEEPDLASEPTLLAPGRTGPDSGGFTGTTRDSPVSALPARLMVHGDPYEDETREVADTTPSWSEEPQSVEMVHPHVLSRSMRSSTEPMGHLAGTWGRHRRELTLAVGLAFLAVAGGVGGYLLADSGPEGAGGIDSSVTVVQVPRTRDFTSVRAVEDPPTPDEGLAAAGQQPEADASPDQASSTEGLLRLVGTPQQASVTIDGRRVPGETPLQVRVSAGRHRVTVNHAGFEEMAAFVTVPEGGSVTHAYRLKRRPRPEVVSVKPKTVFRRQPRVKRHQPSRRRRIPKPVEDPPARPAGVGYVSVSTIPWSRVYLGARDLGVTPLANVPLPSGKHRLRLVNPTMEERYVNVTIAPRRTTKVRLQLRPR